MRVLVLGSGAREHALVARLAADLQPGHLVAAPGNPGIARVARTVPIDLTDIVYSGKKAPDETVRQKIEAMIYFFESGVAY